MIEYLNNDNQNMQLNLGKLRVKMLTVAYKDHLELNDKIDEVLEDIRKTVEVDNEEIEEIPEEDEVEQEEEEEVVDQPLFIPAMSAGPELENAPTQQQSGSIPLENPVTSIPSSQPVTQPFVQSTPSFQELTPEFQEKKIKSLEDRFKCHLQEKINILKVVVQNQRSTDQNRLVSD